MNHRKKIVLGTAQLGLSYGITNQDDFCMSNSDAQKILNRAYSKGVRTIDTAPSYGLAQIRIGKNDNKFKIISKISSEIFNKKNISEHIKAEISETLENLQQDSIDCLLIHSSKSLLSKDGEKIYTELESLKQTGAVKKIGVSVYSCDDIREIIKNYKIDVCQFPINIFDLRFRDNGCLEELRNKNIEAHARSIFLQGLLLLEPEKLPKKFFKWRHIFEQFHMWCLEKNLSSLEACLNFVFALDKVDKILIGVSSINQLNEILKLELRKEFIAKNFNCSDELLLNPSMWKNIQ